MLFLKEVLTWVYLGGKVAQTFAPLTRISHDRIRHIWHPRKSIDQEKGGFSQSFQAITVAAAAPRSLRQGQVFKACWNLKVHPTPFMTLSFLSKVTESTFSMLDTKYSSWSLKTSSRKLASRHWEIKAWMYTSKFSWNCAVSAYERFRISLKNKIQRYVQEKFWEESFQISYGLDLFCWSEDALWMTLTTVALPSLETNLTATDRYRCRFEAM